MTTLPRCLRIGVLACAIIVTSRCGIVGPSCTNEDVTFMNVTGQASAGSPAVYTVESPKDSNLLMRLTWPDHAATLDMRATITACGTHVGCGHDTFLPTFGPGGASPEPQPWPAGLREMLVDGSKGKTYRVEIMSNSASDASFALSVTYERHCES